jgi:hypothetical protein
LEPFKGINSSGGMIRSKAALNTAKARSRASPRLVKADMGKSSLKR